MACIFDVFYNSTLIVRWVHCILHKSTYDNLYLMQHLCLIFAIFNVSPEVIK